MKTISLLAALWLTTLTASGIAAEPTAMQQANAIRDVNTRRCAACHKPDEVTRLDWIDLQAPAKSRFLAAPLAASAGGLGKCKGDNAPAVYTNAADPDCAAVLNAVTAAVKRAWDAPRRDLRLFKDPVPAPRLAPQPTGNIQ